MRVRERRGARRVLDKARLRPAASHVGERGRFLAGIGERQPGKPARVAITSAVPNGEG